MEVAYYVTEYFSMNKKYSRVVHIVVLVRQFKTKEA